MQIVSQKISTGRAPVAVVDSEKRAFRPLFLRTVRWLHYIENYRHSVFVVISYNPLVRVRRVSSHNSIAAYRAFCRVIIRDRYFMPRLQRRGGP